MAGFKPTAPPVQVEYSDQAELHLVVVINLIITYTKYLRRVNICAILNSYE